MFPRSNWESGQKFQIRVFKHGSVSAWESDNLVPQGLDAPRGCGQDSREETRRLRPSLSEAELMLSLGTGLGDNCRPGERPVLGETGVEMGR